MICFLTSSPFIPGTDELNSANGFIDEMKRYIPAKCKALFISSNPDDYEHTDGFAQSAKSGFGKGGFSFQEFQVLDRRNQEAAETLINDSDFIILAGGHVPTQNKFFGEIDLREHLNTFQGIVMGISAGTMNSADIVYAHPELEGEAVDSAYQKYLVGLNLTKAMILPHYQMIKDDILDGLRVFEDIAYPDSYGKKFYALVDGSYLLIQSGREEIRGEAYLIRDGMLSRLSSRGEVVRL